MSTEWSMVWAAAAIAMSAAFADDQALADDQVPSVGPGSEQHKALQARCGAMTETHAREQCMRDAEAAAEKAGEHCADLTLRAREQCLADAKSTQQQQAQDQAAGGAQSGATGGVPAPATASPGEQLEKQ